MANNADININMHYMQQAQYNANIQPMPDNI